MIEAVRQMPCIDFWKRILSTNIPSEHSRKRKVFNPSLGELIACIWQVDEFRYIKAQFITQRLTEGATMQQAVQLDYISQGFAIS